MWGYGPSHEYCTGRSGMRLLVRVLYALMIWTLEHDILIWLYVGVVTMYEYEYVLFGFDHLLVYALIYVYTKAF